MIVDERAAVGPAPVRAEPAGEAPLPVRWTPLAAVLVALPFVALAELFLIRTFYRVGIFIPKEGPFRAVYAMLTAAGSFAFNLSSVLAALALAMLSARAARPGRRNVAAALAVFLGAVLLVALSGSPDLGPASRLFFVLAVAVVAWPHVRTGGNVALRLSVAGVAVSALLSSYAGLVGDAWRLVPAAGGPGGATGAQLAAEAVVVLTAFALFAAWVTDEGLRAGPLVLGVLPAVALFATWRVNGAVTGILVLWTAGLRLYLPVWLYAVALWAFTAAALGWLPRRPWRSAGLALLLAGGMLLESTYLQMLAVLALVLLTDGVAVGGLPALARRAHAEVR